MQRSNVCHKVKHRQATWRFLMRLLCSFHAQYLSFFLFFPAGLWSFPLSFNRERSSYHQSAFSSCGLRQCHAGLCVLPDRTTVPSGYPYTSSLTPLIFTRYRENWKNTWKFEVGTQESNFWTVFSIRVRSQRGCFCQSLIAVLYSQNFSDAVSEKLFYREQSSGP